jgi:hypothetical protein
MGFVAGSDQLLGRRRNDILRITCADPDDYDTRSFSRDLKSWRALEHEKVRNVGYAADDSPLRLLNLSNNIITTVAEQTEDATGVRQRYVAGRMLAFRWKMLSGS